MDNNFKFQKVVLTKTALLGRERRKRGGGRAAGTGPKSRGARGRGKKRGGGRAAGTGPKRRGARGRGGKKMITSLDIEHNF